MPNEFIYFNSLDRSISYMRAVWLVFIMFCRNFKLNANSVDPDQTQRSVASYLSLHCLPMSLLWDTRLKWVNRSPDYTSIMASFYDSSR